jgi:DNA-binding NarL/FixJ family response regulator
MARLSLATSDTQDQPAHSIVAGFTPREKEVASLLVAGCTDKEIANRLYISPKTASVHVSNVVRKLGVHNRFDAGRIAARLGVG